MAEAHGGRACTRVDVSPAGLTLIAADVVLVPVVRGVRWLIPGIPVDWFVDATLDDDEVRLARPTDAVAHVPQA